MLTIISSLVIILIVFGLLVFALQRREKHSGNTEHCGTCSVCSTSTTEISDQSNGLDYFQEK